MSIVSDAVKKMEDKIFGSGCDHGTVSLKKSPDSGLCPYVKGECIRAEYGGKFSEIVSSYPIEAATKVSFMYGQPLNSPVQRTAACAIINVLSNFMCFTRISSACEESRRADCIKELKKTLGDQKVYLNGSLSGLFDSIKENTVQSPDDADIIIVSGDGIFDDEMLAVTEKYIHTKRFIFTGPTTAGICALEDLEHWCPYGKR